MHRLIIFSGISDEAQQVVVEYPAVSAVDDVGRIVGGLLLSKQGRVGECLVEAAVAQCLVGGIIRVNLLI